MPGPYISTMLYHAATAHVRGGIIPKGSRPRKPLRGVGDAAPYNGP